MRQQEKGVKASDAAEIARAAAVDTEVRMAPQAFVEYLKADSAAIRRPGPVDRSENVLHTNQSSGCRPSN